MSLDIYLISDRPITRRSSGIYIRENGRTKEISIAEWNAKNPDCLAMYEEPEIETNEVFRGNITHNLSEMAKAAGIYDCLWNTEDVKANVVIDSLREGLHKLKLEPEKYKQYNPKNGWGDYDLLVNFISNYLDACYLNPDARIEMSK